MKKITTKELISVTSKYSSMRWGFITLTRVSVIMIILSVIASLVASFLNAFIPSPIKIDLSGIALLLGSSITGSFIGKAGQSFAEGKYNMTSNSEESAEVPEKDDSTKQ